MSCFIIKLNSMKIIDLKKLSGNTLTADSTLITADSTIITADATFSIGAEMTLKIIPREYVDEVVVTWYNELKQTTYTENCFTRIEKGYLIIPYLYKTFVEGDSFEVSIKSTTGKLLHRTKAYATMSDDLQNYKLNVANNNGIIEI